MGLMSQAGLGPKSGSRHVCLIIALTGQLSPALYKGDKGMEVMDMNLAHRLWLVYFRTFV